MSASNLKPMYAVQAATLDIVLGLTSKTLDTCQKLTEVSVQAMKESIAEGQENMRKAFAIKDAEELFALQASFIEPLAERTRNYLNQVNEITAAARAEFQKVAEAQYESGMCTMQEAFDNISQSAPNGSEGALNAWQSAMTSTATFYESVNQATRHAIELAENRVADAAATLSSAAAQQAKAQAARAVAKR